MIAGFARGVADADLARFRRRQFKAARRRRVCLWAPLVAWAEYGGHTATAEATHLFWRYTAS